uniref:hypothetical protein n=1 Tax=Staphylococcus haemolyticus TaxID=1283 RepID=UPI001C5CB0F8
ISMLMNYCCTTFKNVCKISISNGCNHLYTHYHIMDMIYSYQWHKNILINDWYFQDSNLIAQYSIESTFPNPQGKTTDKVQAIATRNYVLSRIHDEHIEFVSFIDKYEHNINNDMNLNILYLFKKGKKPKDVREIMNIGRTNLDSRINEIVNVYVKQQDKHNQQLQQDKQHQH